MGRTLFIYTDGTRYVTDGGIIARPGGVGIQQTVNLGGLNEADYQKVKANPTDHVFLAKVLPPSVVLKIQKG